MMRCILFPVFLLALSSSCDAFAPATSVGLRATSKATTRHAVLRQGARNLQATAVGPKRSIASKPSHAPTGMDWEKLTSYPWGSVETDFMTIARCGPETDGEWTQGEVMPYGDLTVSPKAAIFNYGQGLFEGMKAQRTDDGRIVIFRPEKNAARCAYGCERLCMPPIPEDIFVDAIKKAVLANAKWVPPKGQGSLYLRTLIMGTGALLDLAPSPSYTMTVYVSPVGSYFKGNQLSPIKLKLETEFSRAAPGGSGGIKAVGNYAPSLKPQKMAKAAGFDNVIYMDAAEQKYIEEVGAANIFVVKGNTVLTPAVRGKGNPQDTILEGVTRDSIMTLLKDKGFEVVEKRVSADELLTSDEAFTVGTAVVVSPIGAVEYKGAPHEWDYVRSGDGAGPVTKDVYETLVGIQTGERPDPYGWTVYLD